MKIVNLTGSEVRIANDEGVVIATFPSHHRARPVTEYADHKMVDADGIQIPLKNRTIVDLGLPEPAEDTIYLVNPYYVGMGVNRDDIYTPVAVMYDIIDNIRYNLGYKGIMRIK